MKGMLLRLASLFVLLLFAIACGATEGAGPHAPADDVVTSSRRGRRILPKAMTADERRRAREMIQRQGFPLTTYAAAPPGNIRVPAEYEPMEGVLVRVANDESMDAFFGHMIKGILQAKAVPYLVYADAIDREEIIDYTLAPMGISANQVKWVQNSIDAFWARDYGPWHVYADGKRTIVDIKYYPTRAYDDAIPIKLGGLWKEDVYKAPLYVEGGNFMTDGKGTCWTSTGIFFYNNLSPAQLTSLYKKYLGCQKVYFPPPLYREGTTHLDMFSKLINDSTILVGYSKADWGASSAEINSLDEAARFYEGNTNAAGKPFKVVRIPMYFVNSSEGRAYYAYTNSTIVNKAILVPLYGRSTDATALEVYKEQMPGYEVIGIKNGQDVIIWGGSVHCTTMQIPTKTTANADGKGAMVTDSHSGSLGHDEWKTYGPYDAASGDFKARLTGSGDVDLYVWKDTAKAKLTTSNFSCSPYDETSFEQCSVAGPGTFYVGVNGAVDKSDFSLTIEYNKK